LAGVGIEAVGTEVGIFRFKGIPKGVVMFCGD